MARDYNAIQKEIALTGFFSEYLPPCFQLNNAVLKHPPAKECDLIPPLNFSMSRFNKNGARRTIFIPEIGSYVAAYQCMKDKKIMQELIEFSEKSDHSLSPILGENDTIMRHDQVYGSISPDKSESKYIDNIIKKIKLSAGAKKILKLDISNCYSSFYMHMIPAIILGSEQAAEEYKKSKRNESCTERYTKYSELDKAIRRQNLNRTNGLLPGILSSRIITESLLTRIDIELESAGLQFIRYVDDYEVFLYDDDEKNAISIFTQKLKSYGFTLNAEKTEVVDFPYYVVENFNKILGNKLEKKISSEDLIDIFDSFQRLEKNGTKGAIRYLVKELIQKSEELKVHDKDLCKSYLLSIMANDERSLTKVCQFLIENKRDFPLTKSEITTISQLLDKHISYEHELESLWLLYLLAETDNIKIDDTDLFQKIIETRNELAYLLLLEYSNLSDSQINQIIHNAESWLLLYELFSRDCISEDVLIDRLNLDKNLNMYKHLKQDRFHFIQKRPALEAIPEF